MKFSRSIAIAFAALSVIAVACGDDDAVTTTTAGSATTTAPTTTSTTESTETTSGGEYTGPMAQYTSDDYPVAMSFPEDWTYETNSFGAVVIFFSPSSEGDQFTENVNLVVEDLGGAAVTLDEYMELATDQLLDSLPDIQMLDAFEHSMGGEPAAVIHYSATQEGVMYQWVQQITLYEGSAYLLTYTGEPETEFFVHLPAAVAIFESFEFRD